MRVQQVFIYLGGEKKIYQMNNREMIRGSQKPRISDADRNTGTFR
jgi:hypothetical protein